jgi:hypothetical protein
VLGSWLLLIVMVSDDKLEKPEKDARQRTLFDLQKVRGGSCRRLIASITA